MRFFCFRRVKMRPSLDEYFMRIAEVVASRSTCLRNKVGAVIVKDKRILTTGYNGAPRGMPHCLEIGCLRDENNIPSGERHEICRAVHAEQNAIIQAALHGVSTEGATLYCTHQPCILCAKMIINAGIRRVVYKQSYPDENALKFLRDAGVEVVKFEEDEKQL
ncbi:MAG: dCMP deaminase [Archaeoglobi archaeon]|nr:dCMP deaminase [Archaeoglobi archaeon]MDK2781886.1 dCMP deaminase [Archaeoglobi archaeon]